MTIGPGVDQGRVLGEEFPVHPNRSRRHTWKATRRLLGLWLATGAVAFSARAQEPQAEGVPGVHGTITIDFEKVTVAELLKLVETLEQVDGDIHLVSTDRRDGRPAIVVGGGRGTLSLADPGKPDRPRLAIARPARDDSSPEPPGRIAEGGERPRPRMSFATLGRWLGLNNGSVPRDVAAATTRPTAPPVSPRHETPSGRSAETGGPLSLPEAVTDLSVGTHIGSMAKGELSSLQAIRSPWPAAKAGTATGVAKTDDLVSQAVYTKPAAPSVAPSRHETSRGETFDNLARRFYGDSRYAWALWWANRDRVAWPDALTEGKSLKVPAIGELDPKMVLAKAGPISDALPHLEPAAPPVDPEMVRASLVRPAPEAGPAERSGGFAVHVVRPEDTLRIIAREKCGDERKALDIIALNRDILSQEGRPRVGQRLILPTTVSAETP